MKIGDLVRVNPKSISERTKLNYPHVTEVGIVIEFNIYHPTVLYSDGEHTVSRSNLKVINESR